LKARASSLELPAVILAGGLATRLRPLSETVPKALIEIEGHPFLWHQLTLLRDSGIRKVVLLVGYLGEQIEERFGDGSPLGISIQYSYDGPVLLGTAGAIKRALPLLPGPFFVLYGDSYLPCDYRAIEAAFSQQNKPGLMTIYRNEGLYDKSNVEYDGARIVRFDKRGQTPLMHYIDYGLNVFDPLVFDEIPKQPCDLDILHQKLIGEGQLAAFEVYERFYEIGSMEGIRDTAEYLRRRKLSELS
jgi:NDP-sugar pyrophosphorylase family protein